MFIKNLTKRELIKLIKKLDITGTEEITISGYRVDKIHLYQVRIE